MLKTNWLDLFDTTWPKVRNWIKDAPINDMLTSISPRGKRPFSFEVFIDYQGIGFYEMMDRLRKVEATDKLWRICVSIWCEAPDHPIVHDFTGWDDFCKLCENYPNASEPSEAKQTTEDKGSQVQEQQSET